MLLRYPSFHAFLPSFLLSEFLFALKKSKFPPIPPVFYFIFSCFPTSSHLKSHSILATLACLPSFAHCSCLPSPHNTAQTDSYPPSSFFIINQHSYLYPILPKEATPLSFILNKKTHKEAPYFLFDPYTLQSTSQFPSRPKKGHLFCTIQPSIHPTILLFSFLCQSLPKRTPFLFISPSSILCRDHTRSQTPLCYFY